MYLFYEQEVIRVIKKYNPYDEVIEKGMELKEGHLSRLNLSIDDAENINDDMLRMLKGIPSNRFDDLVNDKTIDLRFLSMDVSKMFEGGSFSLALLDPEMDGNLYQNMFVENALATILEAYIIILERRDPMIFKELIIDLNDLYSFMIEKDRTRTSLKYNLVVKRYGTLKEPFDLRAFLYIFSLFYHVDFELF